MKIYLETPNDSDMETLETVDWEAMPRIGDTVVLRGKKYGGDDSSEMEFIVDDVIWYGGTTRQSPSVVLVLPPGAAAAVLFCACDAPEPEAAKGDTKAVCGRCGGRIG